jgi:transposase-like protein
LWLKCSWGGQVKYISVLVAIGVSQSGYRQIPAVSEGSKEDKASWTELLRGLKDRGLKGVELFVSVKCSKASLRSTSDMPASACTPTAYDTKHLKSYDK